MIFVYQAATLYPTSRSYELSKDLFKVSLPLKPYSVAEKKQEAQYLDIPERPRNQHQDQTVRLDTPEGSKIRLDRIWKLYRRVGLTIRGYYLEDVSVKPTVIALSRPTATGDPEKSTTTV